MLDVANDKSLINNYVTIFSDLALLLGMNAETDVPEWFENSGDQWPIFIAANNIHENVSSQSFRHALYAIKTVPQGSSKSRWQSFENLLIGNGCNILWLNESKYIDGRIPSPATFKVNLLYQKAGMEVIGSELPDHASMELTFLAHLASQYGLDHNIDSPWSSAYTLFLKKHIKPWLPEVGSRLTGQTELAWIAIGTLLQALILIPLDTSQQIKTIQGFPTIQSTQNCTLCGFCVQVCPSTALQIIEDGCSTALWLSENICVQCTKCRDICPENVISFNDTLNKKQTKKLIDSPRVACTKCGQMMISKAELDYTANILNNPPWLWQCLDCRI